MFLNTALALLALNLQGHFVAALFAAEESLHDVGVRENIVPFMPLNVDPGAASDGLRSLV